MSDRDAQVVRFLADRLVHVYGESPNLDYIHAAHRAADALATPTDRYRDALLVAEDAILELVHQGWSSLSEERAMAAVTQIANVLAEPEVRP